MFSRMPYKHLDEQLCRWKLLIGITLQQRFFFESKKTHFSRLFSRFRPQMKEKGSLESPYPISYYLSIEVSSISLAFKLTDTE